MRCGWISIRSSNHVGGVGETMLRALEAGAEIHRHHKRTGLNMVLAVPWMETRKRGGAEAAFLCLKVPSTTSYLIPTLIPAPGFQEILPNEQHAKDTGSCRCFPASHPSADLS